MTTVTKLAVYDKAIAEMQHNRIHQTRRLELGEGGSLRSSGTMLFSDGSDSDSDASNGSNGSYGSLGTRHSFISFSEDNNSPSSMHSTFAYMNARDRGSRLMQEEELARLSDVPIDSIPGGESPVNHITGLGIERNVRSPALGSKDKLRTEYFAKIKNEFMHGGFHTPPPQSSPPDNDEWAMKKAHRHSAIMIRKEEKSLEKEGLDSSSDTINFDGKTKSKDPSEKKKEKEKQKEEKLKKKQEKKEMKMKAKAQAELTAGSTSERIAQQLFGSVRPRTSLTHRGTDLDEQLRRPIDTSPKLESPLRRSTSFSKEDVMDDPNWKNRPKYEKILGTPVPDCNFLTLEDKGSRASWSYRSNKIKSIVSDPLPLTAPSSITLPPPPPPPISEDDTVEEPQLKQSSISNKAHKLLGDNPSISLSNGSSELSNTDIASKDITKEAIKEEIDVDEDEIKFADVREQSGHRQVKGATLKKLVERLTCESISDTTFLLQFIITYRSFTNPHELLATLKARYESGIEIGNDVSDAEREKLTKKRLIVRLRVYNVIRQWIDKQWVDFIEDNTLVEKLLSYGPMLNEVVSSKSSAIDKLIEKKKAEGEKQKIIMFSDPPPKPYIPVGVKERLQLTDMHSEEIARQMTLMEYTLFKAIKPWEYLCWNTKMKETKSANILCMVNKFNVMSKWVQREILNGGETPKQRAQVVGKFLEIIEHLRNLKNYNGFMEILSGLNASSVHRLRLTWGCLSSKQNELYQEFSNFSSGTNYKNLRTALHTLQPPCIPYLGMYLTDLTFINDGIPLYLPDSCLINFDKCRKVSASVLEIMQYQQTPFCLLPVEDIQTYFSQLDKKQIETDDEFYKLSLSLEERKQQ